MRNELILAAMAVIMVIGLLATGSLAGLRKYIRNHWRGEHSLPRSYWLNCAVPSTIAGKLAEHVTDPVYAMIAIAFALAVWIWGIVGTWRSASRSKREQLYGGWPTATHVVIVIGIVAAAGSLLAAFDSAEDVAVSPPTQDEPTTLYDELTSTASALNENYPMKVDSMTELTNVGAVPPNIMLYNYRLISTGHSEAVAADFLSNMRPIVTSAVCSTPDLRDGFLANGVTMRYSYYDKNRVHIGSLDVTELSCEVDSRQAAPPTSLSAPVQMTDRT